MREWGLALLDDFDHAIARIVESSRRWPPWTAVAPKLGVRRCFLTRFPYYVPYLIEKDGRVFVLAFAHEKRRPGYWIARVEDADDT